MGLCLRCFGSSTAESKVEYSKQPDAETRRRQLAEAAEKRLKEQESRGVKDPQKLRESLKRKEELERREKETIYGGNSGLKWQVD